MKRALGLRLLTALATTLLVVAPQAPASAAPPSNDSITKALPLGSAPRTFDLNTSQATSSRGDGECVAGASVWFSARPSVTRTVRLSTLGSDYDTVLTVFRGTRTDRTPIACVDDSFDSTPASAKQVRMVAGTTYWIAVSACCNRSARGGHLLLRTSAPAPAGLTVGVDSVKTGGISGQLVVEGTAQCATPSEVFVGATVAQRVNGGTNVARGSNASFGLCEPGDEVAWTIRIDSDTGWAFQPGDLRMTTSGAAWDGFGYDEVPESTGTWTATNDPAARAR